MIGCSIMTYIFFRSPWTNTYDPPLEDGAMPSERLRKLEIEANAAFDQVRNPQTKLQIVFIILINAKVDYYSGSLLKNLSKN